MEPITATQIKQVHVLLKQSGLTQEQYRALLTAEFAADSSATLTQAQAKRLCAYLYRQANPDKLPQWRRQYQSASRSRLSPRQVIWARSMWSRVTRAGDAAAAEAALNTFIRNKFGVSQLSWLPRAQAPKLIAMLEAMERQEAARA